MLLDISLYASEIILCITLCSVLLIQLIANNRLLTLTTALLGIGVSAIAVVGLYSIEPQLYFSKLLSHDPLSLFFKLFFLVATAFTFLFSYHSHEIDEARHGEFYLLTLSVTIGMSTLVAANHLLSLYLSLELVSIISYALAGFRKEHALSNEAAIKYLLYGAMASGTLLWGLSLLYGFSGSLDFAAIRTTLTSSYIDPLSLYTILFMLLFGFGFKMAFVPFHMWAPDVYQGSPTPTAAFFTVAPKAAGFGMFIRFFYTLFVAPSDQPGEWIYLPHLNWPLIIAIFSAVTMTLGNLGALWQKDAKRMLGYSSIAHAGYMMMGLVVLTKSGLASVLFYLVVYFLMNFGAFYVVGLLSNRTRSQHLIHFKGLGWRSPYVGIAMAIFLLSLTGIPPFGGFIGKVYLFSAVIEKEIYWLVIIAAINTVISLYYYVYVIRLMFLERAENESTFSVGHLEFSVLMLLVVPTIILGLYWEPLMSFISQSFLSF